MSAYTKDSLQRLGMNADLARYIANNAPSGGGGGGALTVNTSTISGASAGKLLYSDGSLLQATGDIGLLTGLPQNVQNGNYTLVLADAGKSIYHTSASAHAYTVPPNASVAYPIGSVITFVNNAGGGTVTITAGGGVTFQALDGTGASTNPTLAASTQLSIIKLASDTWGIGSASGASGITSLTVGSTGTTGGAAGQIMIDSGSALTESANLVFASNILTIGRQALRLAR